MNNYLTIDGGPRSVSGSMRTFVGGAALGFLIGFIASFTVLVLTLSQPAPDHLALSPELKWVCTHTPAK